MLLSSAVVLPLLLSSLISSSSPRPLLVSPSLSPSLRRYFRPLGLSAAVCLPIISPPSHGPIRPRAVLRFSPCRPIIRSLFTLIFSFVSRPHTREPRNLYYSLARIRSPPFPLVFRTPTFTSSTLLPLSLLLRAFPVAPIKAAVSKPVALSRTRARSRFFPMRGFFSRCYCRLSDASHSPGMLFLSIYLFYSLSSLEAFSRRQLQYFNKYRKVR